MDPPQSHDCWQLAALCQYLNLFQSLLKPFRNEPFQSQVCCSSILSLKDEFPLTKNHTISISSRIRCWRKRFSQHSLHHFWWIFTFIFYEHEPITDLSRPKRGSATSENTWSRLLGLLAGLSSTPSHPFITTRAKNWTNFAHRWIPAFIRPSLSDYKLWKRIRTGRGWTVLKFCWDSANCFWTTPIDFVRK